MYLIPHWVTYINVKTNQIKAIYNVLYLKNIRDLDQVSLIVCSDNLYLHVHIIAQRELDIHKPVECFFYELS